jgi:allophanate hydrolase
LRRAYAAGVRPRDIVDEFFRRLEAADDPGIFISVADRSALQSEADALGAFAPARSLWGIPVAVKDNIDSAGFATTVACPAYAYTPEADAEVVVRLRAAGALIVGKTNLDQFATGLVGTRTPYPVPRNAIDAKLAPGGSSSGSAIAVARGIVPVALGSDTAGSGRVPAALNNIVGLKPSLGAVSTRGLVPACRSLDCVSIFALTVEDAWTVYRAIAGYYPADPYSAVVIPKDRPGTAPIRLGVPRDSDLIFSAKADDRAFTAALAFAEKQGAEAVRIEFTDFYAVARLLYDGPWLAERYAAIRDFIEQRPGDMLPITHDIIGAATSLSAADAFDGFDRLRELARRIEPVWSDVDVICVPSIPGFCTLADIEADPLATNARLGTYTNFVNLLGLCALTVPMQEREDGRPASVTLIGRAGADALLAALGHRLHRAATSLGATSWPPPFRDWQPEDNSERVQLVVFGAHLSGLPLNHHLLADGGIFERAVRTAPDYRLHALSGRVARPGLVRVATGEGATIEGEVWSLSPAGFGRFVAAIEAPLGIGSIRLEDGSEVKGFIAEAEGVRGTPDISRHGGWRSYLHWMAREAEPAK